jgi:hypothetical protein
MLPTEVRVGWIFRYSYLWDWQHREGRGEGAPVVRVLPITHTPPADSSDAIEIPADVKSRLGLTMSDPGSC